MDSLQAKEILKLYRPGSTDAADPQMAEALEQMKRDPELEQWFEQHCAVYISIREKLKAISIPADLKRDILLSTKQRSKVISFRRPLIMALAAAAMVAIIGLVWTSLTPKYENTFPGFRDKITRTAQRGYNMSMVSTNLTEIREFLKTNRADAGYTLTKSMEQLPGAGCAILHWHGRTVTMVCLKNQEQKDLFLFVANRQGLANVPLPGKPEYSKIYKMMTVSWSADDRVYVLAGPGDEAALRQYLN